MKTIKLLALLFSTLLITNNSFSHGETQSKNRCSFGWQYKAIARVNNGPGIVRQAERGCNPVYPYTAEASNSCAWQWTRNTGGYGEYSGAVTDTYWLCGRGFSNSDLFYDLNFRSTNAPTALYEKSEFEHETMVFTDNKAVIPNINGELFVGEEHIFSSIEVIVWKPDHDFANNIEDTVADQSEYLWQGKIELLNGELNITGDFPDKFGQLIKLEKGHKLVIENLSIEADLPEGVDGVNDDIVVSIITDAGAKESSVLMSLEEDSNELDAMFNVFPNPTEDIININLDLNTAENGDIKVYDGAGKLIASIYSGTFETTINLTYSFYQYNLPPGQYYVLVQSESKQLIKKINLIK